MGGAEIGAYKSSSFVAQTLKGKTHPVHRQEEVVWPQGLSGPQTLPAALGLAHPLLPVCSQGALPGERKQASRAHLAPLTLPDT